MIYCWVLDVDTVESISAVFKTTSRHFKENHLSWPFLFNDCLIFSAFAINCHCVGPWWQFLIYTFAKCKSVSYSFYNAYCMSCVRSWSLLRIKSSISSPLIFPRSSGSKVCSWSPSQGYFGILIRWGNNISLYPNFVTRYYHQLSFCEGIFH